MKQLMLIALLFTMGCGSVATRQPLPSPTERADPGHPLFRSDSSVLSDEEIARILNTRLELPAQMRIALLDLGHRSKSGSRSWRDYERQDELRTSMSSVSRLLEAERIYDVSYLPEFLLAAPTNK